jgi:DNA polymerase-3 subunit beta
MNATIDRNTFMEELSKIVSVTSNAKGLPVLQNALIKFGPTDTFCEVRGTDIETDIKIVSCGVSGASEAMLMVPARTIFDMLRTLKPGEVKFQSNQNTLKITQEKAKFKIALGDPEEFPAPPEIKPEAILSVTGKDLSELIAKTSYAVSTNPEHYACTGLCFAVNGEDLVAVGTDRYRLALHAVPIKEPVNYQKKIVVPKGVIDRISLFIGKSEEVKITIDPARIVFAAGNVTIASRLLNAAFPQFENVMPKGTEEKYTVNREDALSAFRKALIVATKTGDINLGFNEKQFNVAVEDETNRVDDVVEVQTEASVPWALSFRASTLIDVFGVVDGKEITMQFQPQGAQGPIYICEGPHINIITPIPNQ